MIQHIEINNFKSIKQQEFDCKRINIFIGAPNVGKSNILEALSLFCVPLNPNDDNKFKGLIRFDNLKNLFYDNILKDKISIKTDLGSAFLRPLLLNNQDMYELIIADSENAEQDFTPGKSIVEQGNVYQKLLKDNLYQSDKLSLYYNAFYKYGGQNIVNKSSAFYSFIRKYSYDSSIDKNSSFIGYLNPPAGDNLNAIIQENKELFSEISSFFEDYNLELLYDIENNEFQVQKKVDKIIYKYPFNNIADTLKRIIFYLTIVETSNNSSILLEEPETHSYPPYTKILAERIAECEDNQFFITTHSPYILHNLLENSDLEDLNLSIVYFQDFKTKLRQLTKKEIHEILDEGIDVFFNLSRFVNE